MRKATKSKMKTLLWGALGLAVAYGGFRVYRMLPGGDADDSVIWDAETAYSRGALVYREGNFYRATEPSTNVDPNGPRGLSAWRQGRKPLAWSAETRYEQGDQVAYKGQSYRFDGSAPTAGVAPDATIADNPWRRA